MPADQNRLPACVTCKTRKVRCLRADPSAICEGCSKHGFPCHLPKAQISKRYDRPAIRPLAPRHPAPAPLVNTPGGIGEAMQVENSGEGALNPGIRSSIDPQVPASTNNPVEKVIDRTTFRSAIDTYFAYVYCIVPVVHRSTFQQDVDRKREEGNEEEEWTALALSVAGTALAQVPWAYKSMTKSQVRAMSLKCYRAAKAWAFDDFEEISTTRLAVLYLLLLISTRLGFDGSREVVQGALWQTGMKIGFHDETSYAGMDHIEAEIRRRIYWLALGFDKASAATRGQHVSITREHCATTRLPTAIDDEFLLSSGYISVPEDTSILAGFRLISHLYGLFGQVLDMRRLDRLNAPQGLALKVRVTEVEELYHQMMDIMTGCPAELQLREREPELEPPWADFLADGIALFGTSVNQPVISDAFLVQQSNIYVTLQMARHATIQYRTELQHLSHGELYVRLGRVGLGSTVTPGCYERRSRDSLDLETDQTAEDLLRVLQVTPIHVLAVNGDSIVNKVRFVAVKQLTRLEELQARQSEWDVNGVGAAEDQQRLHSAQKYLGAFLQYLTDVEALFSIRDA